MTTSPAASASSQQATIGAALLWSGWVGIAQKTGFGVVPLLPGIWSSLHLDTAVTLPIGVECYAAYALRAWLASGHAISGRTRRFARWPAGTSASALLPGPAAPAGAAGRVVSGSRDQGGVQASLIAIRLATGGKPVSRRALRNGGVKGSNQSLNALARQLNAEFASEQAAVP